MAYHNKEQANLVTFLYSLKFLLDSGTVQTNSLCIYGTVQTNGLVCVCVCVCVVLNKPVV